LLLLRPWAAGAWGTKSAGEQTNRAAAGGFFFFFLLQQASGQGKGRAHK
jgi:hypothetical protein